MWKETNTIEKLFLLSVVLIIIIRDRNIFSEMKTECKPQARLGDDVKDKSGCKAGWRRFTGMDP